MIHFRILTGAHSGRTPPIGTTAGLTDRQRRVVVAAAERGYYETPRRCSLTDLADDLGIAPSTASRLLHRAEGTIVEGFVDGLLVPADEEPGDGADDD